MRIPKYFYLFGEKINVVLDRELEEKTDAIGESHYRHNVIKLNYNNKRPRESIEVTLWHEIIHFILDRIEEKELSKNEKLVSLISQLVHQVLKTMEFEE